MSYLASCCCERPPPCDCVDAEVASVSFGFAFTNRFSYRQAEAQCTNCVEENGWASKNNLSISYFEGQVTMECGTGGSRFEYVGNPLDDLFTSTLSNKTWITSWSHRCPVSFCQHPDYFRFYRLDTQGESGLDPAVDDATISGETYQYEGNVIEDMPWFQGSAQEAADNAGVPLPTLEPFTWYRVIRLQFNARHQQNSLSSVRQYDCGGYTETDYPSMLDANPNTAIYSLREIGPECDLTKLGDEVFTIVNAGNQGGLGGPGWVFTDTTFYRVSCADAGCIVNCLPYPSCGNCPPVSGSSLTLIPNVTEFVNRGGVYGWSWSPPNP